jgi:hypothetical protein
LLMGVFSRRLPEPNLQTDETFFAHATVCAEVDHQRPLVIDPEAPRWVPQARQQARATHLPQRRSRRATALLGREHPGDTVRTLVIGRHCPAPVSHPLTGAGTLHAGLGGRPPRYRAFEARRRCRR